jgi:hypothetical protein
MILGPQREPENQRPNDILSLSQISLFLSKVSDRQANVTPLLIKNALAVHKAEAIAKNDETTAKYTWCLKQVLAIQELYLAAFKEMQMEEFYGAWCTLDRLDVTMGFLRSHFDLSTHDQYSLQKISSLTAKFQALFPYRVFFSTEFVEKEKVCNICKQKVAIRHPCGHTPGEIYRGELCLRIVTDVDLIGISLVETPRHKYAVAFIGGEQPGQRIDHYDYSAPRYVVRRLTNPLDDWSFKRTTKRIPHEHFGTDPGAMCPCKSGKTYEECCLRETGVLIPHYDIYFGSPVRGTLPMAEVHLDRSIASKAFLENAESAENALPNPRKANAD